MGRISYNPIITQKLFYEPSYWEKKIDAEFPEEYIFKEPDYSNTGTPYALTKIFRLFNIITQRAMKDKKSINVFFEYDDFQEALEAHAFITYFSLKNKIHPREILSLLTFLTLVQISLLYKAFSTKKDDTFKYLSFLGVRKIIKYEKFKDIKLNELDYGEDIIKNLTSVDIKKLKNDKKISKAHKKIFPIVSHNFMQVIKTHNKLGTDPSNYSQKALIKFLEYTTEKVIQDIEIGDIDINGIDIKNLEAIKNINLEELNDEIESYKNLFKEKLSNKKSFNYALKHDSHYLQALLKDKLDFIVDKKNKNVIPIFKNFYKGFLIGFYEKGLLLKADKSKVIKELNTIKRALTKLKNQEHTIKQIDEMIEFFKQDKRYERYIPYKAIQKFTKMSKKQIKSLINAILPYKSYSKIYEKNENHIKILY